MNGALPPLAAMAAAFGGALACLAVGLAALWRARALLRSAERKQAEARAPLEAALEVVEQRVGQLEARIEDLHRPPPDVVVPVAPLRRGMNLDRRSQALRMHRHGESPAQIAAALDLPLQEVELLLKVHRVVLRSM